MLHNAVRNPALAKGLWIFGILCTLILTKQIRSSLFMHQLRSSFLVKSIQERLELSEQLWEDSVTKRHAMYNSFVNPLKPIFPTVFTEFPFTVWDYFVPTFNCPHEMQRVGRLGDGGKWTCGMSRYEPTVLKKKPCVVYSFGVRDETSFEEEILLRTECELYGVDYSVFNFTAKILTMEEEKLRRTHFLQAGVAGESKGGKDPPFYTIKDIMDMNGHEYIDIMKMDIEQYEFTVMDKFIQDFAGQPLPIGQLLVEIHLMGLADEIHRPDFPELLQWWERLEASGLRPVWTELNLLTVTLHAEDSLPRCAEYSFINVLHPRNVLLQE